MAGKRRGNGEGCIRKRVDGRWEGRYIVGYNILTGKSIMKYVFAKTRKECADKLAQLIQDNKGPYYRRGVGYGDQPLEVWLRLWYESFAKPNIRLGTAENYENMIENHIIPALGDIKLSRLSSIQIQTFYNQMKERGRLNGNGQATNQPLSASTVKHAHLVLSGALKHAVKEHLIPFNPCDNCKVPKKEKREMKVIPHNKIGPYLEAARSLGFYEMFYLELTSGLRRGELLALLWSDLNVEARLLSVNKQVARHGGELVISVPKTDNSIRTILLSQHTVDLLIMEHEKHPDNPLMFPSPKTNSYWSPEAVIRLHKKMLAMAGVEENVRFHDLRHTFSTMALQSGADVKTVANMLGHYSASFTLDTYTHVTVEMQVSAAEKIDMFMAAASGIDLQGGVSLPNTSTALVPIYPGIGKASEPTGSEALQETWSE